MSIPPPWTAAVLLEMRLPAVRVTCKNTAQPPPLALLAKLVRKLDWAIDARALETAIPPAEAARRPGCWTATTGPR